MKNGYIKIFLILISALIVFKLTGHHKISSKKLYWFIPDGMRADPELFNIYNWADSGGLPNIKKMMDNGSYGFCKPVYPGHTPVNFATLFTGSYPEVHGVSDGPMHESGRPLSSVSVGGFSSVAKKVDPIWLTLEKQGRKVGLLSIPGSTPPELETGYTMLGRWGGWGASFHAVNFEEEINQKRKYELGSSRKLFFFGPPLMKLTKSKIMESPPKGIISYSPVKEVQLSAWGNTVYAYIYDSTDNSRTDYDHAAFVSGNEAIIADLAKGQWSSWLPIRLEYNKSKDKYICETQFRIKLTKLDPDGFYVIRFYYNAMNETLTEPDYLAEEIIKNVGPMVDFADNFPPQLIYYPEDKDTFIEEANMSLDWHKRASDYFISKYKPEIFIHDIYTPNQMLTSRWWLGYIDPESPLYSTVPDSTRSQLMGEVRAMYKKLDDIIGVMLSKADKNTIVVLSSDHGAVPLHTWVNLNNLFASKGLLVYRTDPDTGDVIIDWQKSMVVYLKFGHVFINPNGLHDEKGLWYRSSGPEYEALREKIIALLTSLEYKDGKKPLAAFAKWEDAEEKFRLPSDRIGDLVISNTPGFGWNEKISHESKIFSASRKTGYKQAIITDNTPGMWTPFVIMGPGVKKGNFMGPIPLNMVDQYPTIMTLLDADIPGFVQGKKISEVFDVKE